MNLRLSGKKAFGACCLLFPLAALALFACTKEIPGNPEKTVKEYIEAVQKGDFETIYRLNRVTARQKKFLEKTEAGNVELVLKQNFERQKAAYFTSEPDIFSGALWTERYFFPPSSSVKVGKARSMSQIGDDPVNVEYEKGFLAIVPVETTYASEKDAPKLKGQSIKKAVYDCNLAKIRQGDNVRIYSHDEKWFIARCILDTDTVEYFNSTDMKK